MNFVVSPTIKRTVSPPIPERESRHLRCEICASMPPAPWADMKSLLAISQSSPSCRSFVRETSITLTCNATWWTPPTVMPLMTSR